MLKSNIERTTTDDVIQIGTSQVKLGKEFDGPVALMIRLIRSWRTPYRTMGKRRLTRLLIPSICIQDGILPVLLTLKSGASTPMACGDAGEGAREAAG
jgi:hypothetical protein